MSTSADICVIGAGPVGLAFAAALKRRCPRLSLVVLDRGENRPDDGKSVAFGARAQSFLRENGAWPNREKPILRAEVSFPPFPPLLLQADENAPLARIAPHEEVRNALLSQAQEEIQSPVAVAGFRDNGEFAEAELRDSPPARAKLLVLACVFSPMPNGFEVRNFDYGQCAIALSGKVENKKGWDGETAFECFSPNGILTLVPRFGEPNLVGAVICAGAAAGAEWNGLSDDALSQRLSAPFAAKGFNIRVSGARKVYAPQLRRVLPRGRGRIVCIGQGATIVHPIGAQGLNLALRDANALASAIAEAPENLDQPEAGGLAEKFARNRARDHFRIVAATHSLALLARRRAMPLRAAGGLFCAMASAEQAAPLRAKALKVAIGNY